MPRKYGLLNLNKPTGVTSRRVVDCVQKLVRPAKVGHAGTLDPLATGVLVVPVGAATRLVEYVHRMPKHYRATFLLGRESPTEDTDGEVTQLENPPIPSLESLRTAAGELTGQIMQRPPAYSALKVRGRRAYKMARSGEQVELKPRPVTIYRLEVEAYDYPQLELSIECSSGTYVRSLGRDLADSLGTAVVMSGLVRTAVGNFTLEDSVDPDSLSDGNWREYLIPPLAAVPSLRRVQLTAEEIKRIRTGLSIRPESGSGDLTEQAGIDSSGRLIAILVPRGDGHLGPKRNFPPED
jgi:tRNA pseudouridine55 synthase